MASAYRRCRDLVHREHSVHLFPHTLVRLLGNNKCRLCSHDSPVGSKLHSLGTVASVEAIFLSTFILVSQNRMAEADRKHADLDLQGSAAVPPSPRLQNGKHFANGTSVC